MNFSFGITGGLHDRGHTWAFGRILKVENTPHVPYFPHDRYFLGTTFVLSLILAHVAYHVEETGTCSSI